MVDTVLPTNSPPEDVYPGITLYQQRPLVDSVSLVTQLANEKEKKKRDQVGSFPLGVCAHTITRGIKEARPPHYSDTFVCTGMASWEYVGLNKCFLVPDELQSRAF